MGRRHLGIDVATEKQKEVLRAVAQFDRPASPSQIANVMGMLSKARDIGSILPRLRERGWLVSDVRPEPGGRGRAAFYSLTPAGRALVAPQAQPRPDPEDGDDYADRAAWQAHRAMAGGRR